VLYAHLAGKCELHLDVFLLDLCVELECFDESHSLDFGRQHGEGLSDAHPRTLKVKVRQKSPKIEVNSPPRTAGTNKDRALQYSPAKIFPDRTCLRHRPKYLFGGERRSGIRRLLLPFSAVSQCLCRVRRLSRVLKLELARRDGEFLAEIRRII
jgi:hypothetical protein